MVCGRSEKENLSKSDMNDISRSLANKRLLSLANSYLENLRQEARIVFQMKNKHPPIVITCAIQLELGLR